MASLGAAELPVLSVWVIVSDLLSNVFVCAVTATALSLALFVDVAGVGLKWCLLCLLTT